jgi:hypothetical protein
MGRYRDQRTSQFSWNEITLEEFLKRYEDEGYWKHQRLLALEIALEATPTRWWGANK